ncbi:MAG: formate dehydrogenase family accessory protein FdhD [Sphingobacteriales bacterium 50-39]|nr:formate dehydrogenase accessory sulfurtransferase FdhD [Sphingobacteriales bacterium]OJW58617.1 MAG: formate dehydrogenase family accessory protein FdhD [Sphingobacteriales bacterium 50-39]
MIQSPGIARMPIQKIQDTDVLEASDELAVEEPLEIRLQYGPAGGRQEQSISITMRTPGNDVRLAMGFLYTEGILPDAGAVKGTYTGIPNSILISLREDVSLDLGKLQRHFYTTSSCGVCGKSSLDSLRTVCPSPAVVTHWQLTPELLHPLPGLLRQQQDIYGSTGGLHASALFHRQGHLLALQEDIGRHNALDKLIGWALQEGQLPLTDHILLLSGRACFELIQKAAMAGIKVVAAVGAPSSLAVELAKEYDMTLIGFLRDQRFNIYAGTTRIRV